MHLAQAHEQEAADALKQGDGATFLDVRAVLNDTLEDAFAFVPQMISTARKLA